jgi:hypothetical protein
MNSQSFRFEMRAVFRWTVVLGAVLLLALAAGMAWRFSPFTSASREIRVHGHRVTMGKGVLAPLAPSDGDEERGEEGEGDKRARLVRWIESRHRAAPGVDWHAIEAANREAALLSLAAKAGGPQPVWHERGPLNMTGATAATVVRPDGRTLLVGSGMSGVFSGTPGGKVWAPLSPGFGDYLFLDGFVVTSPPETWVMAVEGRREAVYVSRNRGAAWALAKGLANLYQIDEVLQDGGDRRTIYLLGASAQDDRAVRVLARSRDGGLTFAVVQSWDVAERPGIWARRTGAGPLYLMSRGQLFTSTDHGSSFAPLGEAIAGQPASAVLRGSEAGAPTLYAAVAPDLYPRDLYASDDGGHSWEKRSSFDITVFFPGTMEVSIQHPDLVLFGGVDAWRSTDGGRHFAAVNEWYDYYGAEASRLHADVRRPRFALYRGRETLFFNTDGGSYLSTDGGASVVNFTLNGLGNAQFYSTWSSATNPDLFLAGSQDQGLQQTIVPRGARAGAPLGTVQKISGDYGNLTSASHDLTNVFAFYPGSIVLFAPGGDTSLITSAPLPKMTAGSFFAASAADPDDPSTVYVGGDHIWRMTYQGGGGNDFVVSRLSQNFSPDGQDYVMAIAIAPSDHRVWYAATAEGRIWSSRDHGESWSAADVSLGASYYTAFNALRVSATDPLTAFVGGSGYSAPSVLVTHDGGASWSPLDKGLPPTAVSALAFDGAGTLYAAADAGPYVLNAATATWKSLLGGGAPLLPYTSVEGVPGTRLVRFGTYGRGVWDYVVPGGR